jgi:hypothetical protein
MSADVGVPVPVTGFVLFQIERLDTGRMQLPISEPLLARIRAFWAERGVVQSDEDTAMAAAFDLRGANEDMHVQSVNATLLATFGEGAPVGASDDTLACLSTALGTYVAGDLAFLADGEGLRVSLPGGDTVRLPGPIAGCWICRPEEAKAVENGARKINRVVNIDAVRWAAAKEAGRAKA